MRHPTGSDWSAGGRFAGKAAIVTGAGRGIGRATALMLARDGARVLVNYLSDSRAAEALVHEIHKLRTGAVFAHRADIGKLEEVKGMVQACIREFGSVDILVNSAGFAEVSAVDEMSDWHWSETMRVNATGVFLCVREVVPHMLDRGGTIVNVSSMAAVTGGSTSAAYAASKGAVNAFTKKVARELAPRRIRVNAVMPGLTDTDLQRRLGSARLGVGADFADEALRRSIPIGRMAHPDEIANVIAFLCSDEASYVTGACWEVAGGR